MRNAKEKGVFDGDEEWRKKIQSILPADGIFVKHIRTGEDINVSRRVVAMFVMMTMVDFSDQLFGFQDVLFDNKDGRLEFSGNNTANALWPGEGKPGLWMNSLSRMGGILLSDSERRGDIHGRNEKKWKSRGIKRQR